MRPATCSSWACTPAFPRICPPAWVSGSKLPTGVWHSPKGPLGGTEFDRDTLPGTGAVSLMVGAYHFGKLGKSDALAWFTQARFQAAVATQGGYRPGDEVDGAIGVTYDLGRRGPFTKVAPHAAAHRTAPALATAAPRPTHSIPATSAC